VTVAILVKVYDGIVLATDSATSLASPWGTQVYNSANKIFQLHRHKPIGAMTWGLGNLGTASNATVAKDLRRRLMGKDPAHPDWALVDDFTVEDVANRMVELIYDEIITTVGLASPLGFLVGGYSDKAAQAEAWLVPFDDPRTRPQPVQVAAPDTAGWVAFAQPEATVRLTAGYDPAALDLLVQAGLLDAARVPDAVAALKVLDRQVALPAMPFADAIGLARFLVDVTAGYSYYNMGPNTVGGPVEVAGITRYEGFKWVARKHYYSDALNPEEPRHDH
jgi:hypothetical protein